MLIENMNRAELETSFKEMVLSTVEAIIKHNNKAAEMIRTGDYDEDDKALFKKKILNLVHILYPVRDISRVFLQDEHPEYLHILDYVEKVYTQMETPASGGNK